MSLILDALRKSEAERRRGLMPDLHAELPPIVHATARRKRALPWWFAALAMAMAAAALAWSQWASRSPPVSTPASDGPDQAVAATAASTRPAPSLPTPAPATTPPATQPVAPPRPVQAIEPAASDAAATAANATPPPAIATERPALAAPSPDPRYEPAIANATAPAAPAPLPARASAGPMPAPPNASQTVRLADLSPGEREQLPPLKISMHMWGPAPEQRFAIIDGARVGQGDRVGDAVVEEILAEGVVLDWHGRRLSLPLR